MKAKRVAIYDRVVGSVQDNYRSNEALIELFSPLFVQHPDWEFSGSYRDYQTSYEPPGSRLGFLNLIGDCYKGECDIVLVRSADDISKELSEVMKTTNRLKDLPSRVPVYFLREMANSLCDDFCFTLSAAAAIREKYESWVKDDPSLLADSFPRAFDYLADYGVPDKVICDALTQEAGERSEEIEAEEEIGIEMN